MRNRNKEVYDSIRDWSDIEKKILSCAALKREEVILLEITSEKVLDGRFAVIPCLFFDIVLRYRNRSKAKARWFRMMP